MIGRESTLSRLSYGMASNAAEESSSAYTRLLPDWVPFAPWRWASRPCAAKSPKLTSSGSTSAMFVCIGPLTNSATANCQTHP
jgi:hypothetical protein